MTKQNETGDIDLILIFVLVVSLGILHWTVMERLAESWRSSYQALEDDLQNAQPSRNRVLTALGREWPAPLTRIDYGAYYQKDRDAEALCILGREYLSTNDLLSFRCE
ncbi:MAG: hypothetical protein EOP10_23980 [Proteobacteria bacterium]|nr:MAG: hypothetical protein EOP10_23980 [Pseudomonadota bacterium]